MTTIQITTKQGKRSIDASVYGHLAVHRSPNGANQRITHVPSGLMLAEFPTIAAALIAVGALLTLPVDWSQPLPAPLADQRTAVRGALAMAREVTQ